MTDKLYENKSPKLPQVIQLCGLPGVGKSTIARILLEIASLGWERTDEIRKQMFAVPSYSPEESVAVYQKFLNRILGNLTQGNSVIADATNIQAHGRHKFQAAVSDAGFGIIVVYITCDKETALTRLDNRENDISDADSDVYLLLEPVLEPPENALVIDNSGTEHNLREQVMLKLLPELSEEA